MEEKKNLENEHFLKRYDTVFAFLGLEIMALILFGLGGATGIAILDIAGFFVGLYIFPFITNHYGQGAWKKNLAFLVPFVIFALLIGVSRFWFSYYGGIGFSSIVMNILVALGTLGLFMLGVGLKSIPSLKRDLILLVFLGTLGLFSFITGFYSLCRYGFFYVTRFNGMVYYYDGVLFPIYAETKTLSGFAFTEVALPCGKAASFALACSGVGLFFMNPKENRKRFLILLGLASIGLIDLAIAPFIRALVLLLVIYAAAAIHLLIASYEKKNARFASIWKRIYHIALLAFVAIAALTVVALAVDARTDIIKNAHIPYLSSSLEKGDGFFGSWEAALNAIMYKNGDVEIHKFELMSFLFGISPSGSSIVIPSSKTFAFNILWQNGFIAFALLVYMVYFFFKNSYRFLREDKEDKSGKVALVFMMLGIFVYHCLFANELPFIHSSGSLSAFTRSPLWFGLIFLCGLSFMPNEEKKEEVSHE